MLHSRIGLACFSLLQNRWGWACLSAAERATVLNGNRHDNVHRPDYADPTRYQGGVDVDTPEAPRRDRERQQLARFLATVQPTAVLEIGPGSGHLTRTIVATPTLRRYVAVDLNPAFLDHLRARLRRPGISTTFITGTIADVPIERFDAVVLCSVVHHIPDREALFAAIRARLRDGGGVFASDPTHYLHRLWKIVRKLRTPGHLAAGLAAVQQAQYSTHAMCTQAEYQAVAAATGFRLARVEFSEYSRYRRWWPAWVPGQHWLAVQMLVELEATRPARARLPRRHRPSEARDPARRR